MPNRPGVRLIGRLKMTLDSITLKSARRRGFTLVEALLATMVLAIVGATATLPFVAGMQNIQEAAKLDRAVALGQALMEEIMARPFDVVATTASPAAPAPGTLDRSNYFTILQFNGYAEVGSQPLNYDGTVMNDPLYAGYQRAVSVIPVSYPGQDPVDTGNLVHVQVQVFLNKEPIVRLDRLAAREY